MWSGKTGGVHFRDGIGSIYMPDLQEKEENYEREKNPFNPAETRHRLIRIKPFYKVIL
jgi:hypothetical protein